MQPTNSLLQHGNINEIVHYVKYSGLSSLIELHDLFVIRLSVFEKTFATKQKNVKSRFFWILKKKRKSNNIKVLETTQSVLSCRLSIKLLRPYLNQQFYIMFYVYVFVGSEFWKVSKLIILKLW